jgi:hypothetical protein
MEWKSKEPLAVSGRCPQEGSERLRATHLISVPLTIESRKLEIFEKEAPLHYRIHNQSEVHHPFTFLVSNKDDANYGVYSSPNTPCSSCFPHARSNPAYDSDGEDLFYVFGGSGGDSYNTQYSDLWRLCVCFGGGAFSRFALGELCCGCGFAVHLNLPPFTLCKWRFVATPSERRQVHYLASLQGERFTLTSSLTLFDPYHHFCRKALHLPSEEQTVARLGSVILVHTPWKCVHAVRSCLRSLFCHYCCSFIKDYVFCASTRDY